MYIPAHFIESVRTVDTKKLETVGDVFFGSWGTACAVNEKTNRIYYNDSEEGMVHVIDGKTNTETTSVILGVGTNLMHRLWSCIACDESRNQVYVSLVRQNAVAILSDDPDNNRLMLEGRVTFGNPHSQDPGQFPGAIHMGVAVNRETGMVYVYNTFRRLLNQVDPEEFKLTGQIDLSGINLPMADLGTPGYLRKYAPLYILATDEKRNLIYANNVIVDGGTMRVKGVLPIDKVTGVYGVDNDKNRLYAHGVRGMSIMDPETYDEMLFIPHGCPENPDSELRVFWGVDSPNDRVYLQRHLFTEGDRIRVFDIK
jgi:DNA-binding beta-propeller fold protein YncE